MSWTLLERLLRAVTGSAASAEVITGDLISGYESRRRSRSAYSWLPRVWLSRLWLLGAVLRITCCYCVERLRWAVEDRKRGPKPGRSTRGESPMGSFAFDLRSAARSLRSAKGFAAIAVLTVALGVGATTAIFSLFHGVLLKPLPYPSVERMVRIWPGNSVTKGFIRSFQTAESFEAVSGFTTRSATLSGAREPTELLGGEITSSHFRVVGVAPRWGRALDEGDERSGAEPVVVLSHDLWQRAFGGDEKVLGQTIQLASQGAAERRVVGVMPPNHRPLLGGWEFWIPLEFSPERDYQDSKLSCLCWRLAGRLDEGSSQETAGGQVAAIATRLQSLHPDAIPKEELANARVIPILEDMVGRVRSTLTVLLAAVVLVLLIAVANVANLQLARGESRRSEFALRAAMGASRFRLLRQTMLESLLLGLLGGGLGVGLANILVRAYASRLPDLLPRSGSIQVDLPVLAFSLLMTILASALFGLAPALLASGSSPTRDLHDGRTTHSRRGKKVSQTLVACEVALAVVLVIGAGLMLRTLETLLAVDPGFASERLLTMRVHATGERYDEAEAQTAFFEELGDRLNGLSGISAVADTLALPLSGRHWGWRYSVDSDDEVDQSLLPYANFIAHSPGLFEILEVPLLAGRPFDQTDRSDSDPVGLVSHDFSKRHFRGPNEALGHVVSLNTGASFRIVGVVEDLHFEALSQPTRPTIYRPSAQFSTRHRQLIMKTALEPSLLSRAVKDAVWQIDPNVPAMDVQPMFDVVSLSVGRPRLYTQLLSGFAGLALVLGLIGIYGVLAYTVMQNVRSIGIRMALGATSRQVLISTVGQGLWPTMIGLAFGMLGALALTRVLEGELYGVGARDPATFLVVACLVSFAAVLAAYGPASRAASVEPIETLRSD